MCFVLTQFIWMLGLLLSLLPLGPGSLNLLGSTQLNLLVDLLGLTEQKVGHALANNKNLQTYAFYPSLSIYYLG